MFTMLRRARAPRAQEAALFVSSGGRASHLPDNLLEIGHTASDFYGVR